MLENLRLARTEEMALLARVNSLTLHPTFIQLNPNNRVYLYEPRVFPVSHLSQAAAAAKPSAPVMASASLQQDQQQRLQERLIGRL